MPPKNKKKKEISKRAFKANNSRTEEEITTQYFNQNFNKNKEAYYPCEIIKYVVNILYLKTEYLNKLLRNINTSEYFSTLFFRDLMNSPYVGKIFTNVTFPNNKRRKITPEYYSEIFLPIKSELLEYLNNCKDEAYVKEFLILNETDSTITFENFFILLEDHVMLRRNEDLIKMPKTSKRKSMALVKGNGKAFLKIDVDEEKTIKFSQFSEEEFEDVSFGGISEKKRKEIAICNYNSAISNFNFVDNKNFNLGKTKTNEFINLVDDEEVDSFYHPDYIFSISNSNSQDIQYVYKNEIEKENENNIIDKNDIINNSIIEMSFGLDKINLVSNNKEDNVENKNEIKSGGKGHKEYEINELDPEIEKLLPQFREIENKIKEIKLKFPNSVYIRNDENLIIEVFMRLSFNFYIINQFLNNPEKWESKIFLIILFLGYLWTDEEDVILLKVWHEFKNEYYLSPDYQDLVNSKGEKIVFQRMAYLELQMN